MKRYVRAIPDFPKKGILFRDITPLLQRGPAFQHAIRTLAARHRGTRPDAVVAIESRGLIVGSALAHALGVGVVPVRKKGKLPHKTYQASYTLEYGQDTLEIHQDGLGKGARVLLVDDLLATGGTMEATITLIEQCGGRIVELAFLIELTALKGRQRLARNLLVSFVPAALAGALLHRVIKARLFAVGPVVAALAIGGALMLVVDRAIARRGGASTSLSSLTVGDALLIGLAQSLALWPGMSRAMVTIVAGLLLGLPATTAAEYSFLLAIPTLGAATLFDAMRGGGALVQAAGWTSLLCGFTVAAVVAALAIRGFVEYLTRRGLALFGWYRLGLAAVVWGLVSR